MAGPELLCTQAAEALASNDRELFGRKLRHPRWDPFHEKMESVIKACLQQSDALELLQALKSSGVRMGNRYGDLTIVGMATEALKPDVVEWLLDAGWPLPWGSYTVAPLGVLLEGVSRQIGQGKPEQRPEIQERACQVARLFYRNASAFGPLVSSQSVVVSSQSVEFLAKKFDTPGIEQLWKAMAEEGWDVQNLDEDTQSFVDQLQRKHPEKFGLFDRSLDLARAWQRETALEAVLPAASGRSPKMRF